VRKRWNNGISGIGFNPPSATFGKKLERFTCPKCTEKEGKRVRFWVCDRQCQKKFWKEHKKEHDEGDE
jgi:hypothetical protein